MARYCSGNAFVAASIHFCVTIMRIENWSITWTLNQTNPYSAPELSHKAVCGLVYGHPSFPDGHSIQTSRIVSIDDYGVLTTGSGSVYQLGKVDPNYEAKYPNALARAADSSRK